MKIPEFVVVSRILAPWGNCGHVRVKVETDFPQRFAPGATVYIDHEPMTIESIQRNEKVIIKFAGVDSAEEATKLMGKQLEVPQDEVASLPEGQYYHFQITGLEVWTTDGTLLGNVSEIMTMPSNDVYIVHGSEGEVLIPAIADVVKSIDLEKHRITIEPIAGLLNLNKKKT